MWLQSTQVSENIGLPLDRTCICVVTQWWFIVGLSLEKRREGHWIQSDPEFPWSQLLLLVIQLKCTVGKEKRTVRQRMKYFFHTKGQIGLWCPIVTNSYCHSVRRWGKKPSGYLSLCWSCTPGIIVQAPPLWPWLLLCIPEQQSDNCQARKGNGAEILLAEQQWYKTLIDQT